MGGSFHHTYLLLAELLLKVALNINKSITYLLRRPYRTITNIKTAIIKTKTITAIMYTFSLSFRSKKRNTNHIIVHIIAHVGN